MSFPQISDAATTTEDFLKWEKSAQEAYIQTAVSMATAIASQMKPEIARCLNEWYYLDARTQSERHALVLKIMNNFRSHHPTTVVLAIVEDQCGGFGSD